MKGFAASTLSLLVLAGCDTAPQPRIDSSPATLAAQRAVAMVAARVDSVEEMRDSNPEQLRLFAKVPGNAQLVPVKDSLSWPSVVEVAYSILTDSTGQVLLHNAVPASEDGDWFAVTTHIFDPAGRTIFYRFLISGFAPGCAEVLYEGRHAYFDSSFVAIREESSAADKRGKEVVIGGACKSRMDRATPPQRRAADLPGVREVAP